MPTLRKLKSRPALPNQAAGNRKNSSVQIQKVVSGGQTGVDRAALDVALELGVPCGGWCPKGRWAEDQTIDDRYPLKETPLAAVEQRTEWNARDSDGTLVILEGEPVAGTAFTIDMARRHNKPFLTIDLTQPQGNVTDKIATWTSSNNVHVLNVAGPRESTTPGIYKKAKTLLKPVLIRLAR